MHKMAVILHEQNGCYLTCTKWLLSYMNKMAVILHEQNTTALYANVFLTGIHWLLVTSIGQLAFPSANNCQGQLQTLQSLSVHPDR
jgi:hypothetical protein